MNELAVKETMTSLELVKEINMFREQEGNRAELRHDTLRDIIKDELEDEILSQQILEKSVPSNGGRPMMVYELTLSQAKRVLLRESKFVRKAVIAYIERLEMALKNKFQVPTTFAEALRLAAEQQEKIEEQQKLIEVQTPKAEFYDEVVDSKDAIDMQAVAKVINMGIGRNKLFDFLRNNKVLMQNNQPYQYYIDLGWFRVIESKYTKPSGDICINLKTVVFQKGVDGIRKLIKQNKHKNNKQ